MPQSDKKEFRSRMKCARAALSASERAAQNQAIAERVLAEPAYRNAKTVFCYCSTGDEIDTYAILRDALAQGKTLCLPVPCGRGVMQAHAISDLAQLRPGKYDILEPDESCPVVPPHELDLCIVPCLAADENGFRMGYGGGFYDRYLPQTSAARMLLCAEARLFPRIPTGEYDVPCDILITESQVIYPHEK